MTYGVEKANGSVAGGEFLTGNLNYFTVWSMVPMAATGVRLPLATVKQILGIAAFAGETWEGVAYANDDEYTDALAKQANLDLLTKVFATRANPVIVSVSEAAIADGDAVGLHTGASFGATFGSNYSGAQTEYTVKFVTEKSPSWAVSGVGADAESNAAGYQLLSALEGLAVTDIAAGVITGTAAFQAGAANNDRNILAWVRDAL
jgi:hypothetical protein